MIIGHVAGLIQNYKETFIDSFRNSKYDIVDLDDITDSIMNDDLMIELVEKYDENIEQTKDPDIGKSQCRSLLSKCRELNNKINDYWKKRMEYHLNKLANDNDKNIILIGYINFYRNIRTILNLDIANKIFINIDIDNYCKDTIETNLDMYRDDIINGTFNLEMINPIFLRKRRELVESIYDKKNYIIKDLEQTIKQFDDNLRESNTPDVLYYVSEHKYKSKIPLKELTAYVDEWIAIVSLLGGKKVTKGYIDDDYTRPFIEEKEPGVLENFKRKIYIYVITNTNQFTPIYTRNYIYKYKINKSVRIYKGIEVNDAYTKLEKLGISFSSYKEDKA